MSSVRILSSDGPVDIFIDPATLVENGVCDAHNSFYVAEALCKLFSLVSESPLPHPTSLKPSRLWRKFFRKATTTSIVEFVGEMSSLAHLLLSSSQVHPEDDVDVVLYSTFKKTPVFKEFYEWKKTGSPQLLTYLHSVLVFLKKMSYENEALAVDAYERWQVVEERLSVNGLDSGIAADLAEIVRFMLPSPDTSCFFPKHGPGKVAEKSEATLDDKHRLMTLDPKAHRLFTRIMNPLCDPNGYLTDNHPQLKVSPHAVLRFVPKDVTKVRSICKEPAYRMYLQQGIMRMLRSALDAGEYGRFIHLNDQTFNQQAAQRGSISLAMDTIDLQDASDSVGWDLVKAIFPAAWSVFFQATRSATVSYGSDVHQVKKFAPMGSALCFPVQCIVFTSVVVLASMRWKTGRLSGFSKADVRRCLRDFTDNPYGTHLQTPTIYGDDIICDTRVTDDVRHILTSLRFSVNVQKSFVGSQYVRESCGKYYHNGDDITPVRYSLPFHTDTITDVRIVVSLVEKANECLVRGLPALRRAYIRSVLRDYKYGGSLAWSRFRGKDGTFRVRFTDDPTAFGFLTYGAVTNDHLEVRGWSLAEAQRYADVNGEIPSHIRYQRKEIQCVGVKALNSSVEQVSQHERYMLGLYWRAKADSQRLSEFGHDVRLPKDTRFRLGWTPV